ncbi:hypothetical protein [Conexibacter woesei]|uniref:Uncharacterized protein n=1 Tax=Conexibacter woesei (strain DSM 14684 / CCUG 47730 / CIP 108061 / JCM 11494 / NBRC 100937 / ID131577) TaxID=469383 RepID=D3F5R5_CONWI|nr:hypothetical protein [Conexibacter woesei]ADB52614.1 hypothetical protein Cwoe_4199 [Conexibacter woesei DSM 14684]
MRFHGWNALAASVALVGAVGVVPAAATASAPIGVELTDDARDTPALDERGRLVFMDRAGAVRIIDPSTRPASDRVVSTACAVPRAYRAVAAAGEGFALAACATAAGSYGTMHALDLETGALTALVLPPEQAWGDSINWTGIGSTGACYDASSYKNASRSGIFDWRRGAGERTGPGCGGRVTPPPYSGGPLRDDRGGPGGGAIVLWPRPAEGTEFVAVAKSDGLVTWGVRTRAPRMSQFAYLDRCGLRLRWQVSPLTYGLAHRQTLVLASSARGSGPVTLQQLDVAGACARVERRWRLSLSARGRSVVVSPRAASGSDRATGGDVELLRPVERQLALQLTAGTTAVRLGAPAESVRWRLGDRGWRQARGSGARWSLRAGKTSRRAAGLRLDVRFRDGGRARYEVRAR